MKQEFPKKEAKMSKETTNNNSNSLNKKKIIINIILALIIGLTINILISFFANFEETLNVLKTTSFSFILKIFLAFSIAYLIDILRLYIVTFSFQKRIKFKDAMFNTFSYYFVSNITPMASGGQPYQIYHLNKIGIESTLATNIVLSRFVENLIFSASIILIFMRRVVNILNKAGARKHLLIIGIILSLSFSFIVILLFIRPKFVYNIFKFIVKIVPMKNKTKFEKRIANLENWLEELKESINSLWVKKSIIVIIDFILGGFIVLFHALGLYLTLVGITGINLQFLDVFTLFVIMNFVIYYIPTPGSSGGVEVFYSIVLSGFIPGKFVSSTILIWRFATYYLQIALQGIIMYLSKNNSKTVPAS